METFIGVITKVLDADLYQVEVDIPELNKGLKAFPLRGEVDEPRVGDVVFLRELDPLYHSYYLYEKLKENNYIGIRARGKKIKITKEAIEIGIYTDTGDQSFDQGGKDETPECSAYIKLTKSGELIVKASKITVKADTVTARGGVLKAPGAKAIPSGAGGPFWAGGPVAPQPGTPMISGSELKLG